MCDKWLIFCSFSIKGYAVNLLLQYVNSMNCIVSYGIGVFGGGWLYEWPMVQSMLG